MAKKIEDQTAVVTESKPTPPVTQAQGATAPNVTEVKRPTLPNDFPTPLTLQQLKNIGLHMGQWRVVAGISTATSAGLMANTYFSRGKQVNTTGGIVASIHPVKVKGQVKQVEVYKTPDEKLEPVVASMVMIDAIQNFAADAVSNVGVDSIAMYLSLPAADQTKLLTLVGFNEAQSKAFHAYAGAVKTWYEVYTGKEWPADPTTVKTTTKDARAASTPVAKADDLTSLFDLG